MVKAVVRFFFAVVVASLAAASTVSAQVYQQAPGIIDLEGPRVGITFLSPGMKRQIQQGAGVDIGPVVSQLGWQKEKRFLSSSGGSTAVTEFVALLGGVEQGVVIPSLNWLVGMRTASGIEFAAGPNFSPAGAAWVLAGGVTFQKGGLNFPVNLAVVPSKSGARVSMLVGFNMRRP